jgi:hypothetical protein
VKKTSAASSGGEPAGGVQGAAWHGLPLSVCELRRLLWQLVLAVPQIVRHILSWPPWSRWHQTVAPYYHYQRREVLAGAVAA